jgi:hypothetical protein
LTGKGRRGYYSGTEHPSPSILQETPMYSFLPLDVVRGAVAAQFDDSEPHESDHATDSPGRRR